MNGVVELAAGPSPVGRRPVRTARLWLAGVFLLIAMLSAEGATYHLDPVHGDDQAPGTSPAQAWRSLARLGGVRLQPGDEVRLARGVTHTGQLRLEGVAGKPGAPIVVTSYAGAGSPAHIDGRGTAAAVLVRNCSHVVVRDLVITADGGGWTGQPAKTPPMRCGVLVEADGEAQSTGIALRGLEVRDVSFADPGHVRPEQDVRTPNGKDPYGWGIRFMVHSPQAALRDLLVADCRIRRVDHTGLKFTAPADGIRGVQVTNVQVTDVGGPGVQLSGVTSGVFSRLDVDRSGSTGDSRNWGRGSGLWTWGCRDIVIEHSRFTNANGPGDSAGVHIDFNCRNVIVQYNLSANNAGGFCEVLGNNFNCAYRYNVSINDGHRVKGRAGAFQEGKVFWLSGYVGNGRPPVGPFNTYFYNNTIYVGEGIEAKFAVAPSAEGVLIANNIFHIAGAGRVVGGDQSRTDQAVAQKIGRVVFTHNLYLRADVWPAGLGLTDAAPRVGDPLFRKPGGADLADYLPTAAELVKNRGIEIPRLPGDKIGLMLGLRVRTDLAGRPIAGVPDLGAFELP